MTACFDRVSVVRAACVPLVVLACLAAMSGECFAAPFELLLRNDTTAALVPYRYINLPLEATCLAAYRGMPGFCRDVLEGTQPAPA